MSDALYAALQLFTVGGVIPAQTPWQLDVARFLAPVAVVYAAVVAAVGLLRNQAERLTVALTARHHVVVVGLGAAGIQVARGLRRSGHKVVALEANSDSSSIPVARANGVRVVVGDGTSRHFLRLAQVHRARHVAVMTGDDSRNLEVAAAVRHLLASRGLRTVGMHVAIAHLDLWRELSRLRLTVPHTGVVTEYLHLADRTAQRILNEATAFGGPDCLRRVLIDGDTAVAARVATHLIRRGLVDGTRASIQTTTGSRLRERMRHEEPWHGQFVDLVPAEDGPGPGVALVCAADNDDAGAISRGLVLARLYPDTVVVVTVYRPRSETTLAATGGLGRRVHLVSAKVDALGQELLARSGTELMARVRHEDYVAREHARGVTSDDNPSVVGWNELPESLKESNRRFAESVSDAVGALSAELVPLIGPVPEGELPIDGDLLERLARGEHERWMQALVQDGWRLGEGPKDPAAKRHPLLLSWEELGESEREKDRDAFRALPRMLARIGYALVLPERTS